MDVDYIVSSLYFYICLQFFIIKKLGVGELEPAR